MNYDQFDKKRPEQLGFTQVSCTNCGASIELGGGGGSCRFCGTTYSREKQNQGMNDGQIFIKANLPSEPVGGDRTDTPEYLGLVDLHRNQLSELAKKDRSRYGKTKRNTLLMDEYIVYLLDQSNMRSNRGRPDLSEKDWLQGYISNKDNHQPLRSLPNGIVRNSGDSAAFTYLMRVTDQDPESLLKTFEEMQRELLISFGILIPVNASTSESISSQKLVPVEKPVWGVAEPIRKFLLNLLGEKRG